MRLAVRNGRVVDPAHGVDGIQDLFIAEGRILALGQAPEGFTPDWELNARDQVVCPGLVDLRTRLREPGEEHKATIASETRAAASSGVTTLCIPPDTNPPVDTPAVTHLIRERAEAAGYARVVVIGALTQGLAGEQISEMGALKAAGCVGISNAWAPIPHTLVQRRALEYAATHDLTVFLHAEDAELRNQGCVHEGPVSLRLGLPGIPEAAETVAVARDLALIKHIGIRAHFGQLSTAEAVRMVARARFDGLPVTTDVTAHHLHLTEMDIGYFNSQCHTRPPLRTQRDMEGLRAALGRGAIQAICSDHQPHEPDAKLAPFSETAPGISALETLLPLSLRLVESGQQSLSELIAKLTHEPAQILGLGLGHLGVGGSADICIFDPERPWQLMPETMVSHGRNTPFIGWPLKGRVTHTLLAGKLVYQEA